MIHRAFAAGVLLVIVAITGLASAAEPATQPSAFHPLDAYVTIHNDFFNLDQNGNRINTRSGCLRQFGSAFYWYGGTNGFHDQTCYISTDLVHWTYKGVALHRDLDANRIDVLYNATTRQYVMFLKYYTNGAFLGIATSATPEGPFDFKSQTLVENAKMGDMSVYQDDDGKAYLCYVSWAVGTNAQHGIYLMSPDYLTLDKRLFLWNIRGREAPHIMKRNNIYYYGTSKTAGIRSSDTAYYTATNLSGPWSPATPLNTPGSKNSWDSQVDFVYPFQGTQGTLYMYAGDRWIQDAPNGRQGDYVWLPMEFEGDVPTVNYYQDWDLNVATGTWRKFDPARNLARGKPATASSTNGANAASNVTLPTSYETYVNNKWESAAGDPQWITIDLGAPQEINRVILKWGTTGAKAFSIQTSTDGSTWSDVFSTKLGAAYSVTDETFKTINARYVRMNATQRDVMRGPGRRGGGADGFGASRPATQPGAQAVTRAAAPPPVPPSVGYVLFDFEVLKD